MDDAGMDPNGAAQVPGALLGGRVRRLSLLSFDDPTGALTPITFDDHGFVAVRAFVVRAAAGAVRGGHAHVRGRQILMRASGEIDVAVSHRGRSATVRLPRDGQAVLIEPGVWAQQTYVGDDAALVVFCDTPYDRTDYVEDDDPVVGDE